ncbi:threonine/homoserine/homoserine lactone efflux protein [Breoghania corrubedonensis]|uniref:Threonine/homoserine/homoserine lactone efflux protein n=1 Tax=Breoghania corrubedonensis TaxID=665038 RepID=A0A2T5VEM4_9HYPH|nr:threonine/homoserine/homoserine lactone efflux protein [Breoghania corrubedonensis]
MFFVTGIGIGLIVSAPVGPVNLMTIQRAFKNGFGAGFAAGIGAVLADTLYAAIAAFGISTIAHFLSGHKLTIQAVGGLLLIGFGWLTVRTHPHLDTMAGPRADVGAGFLASLLAAFAMTLTNPGAVLGFLAIFGSLGELTPEHDDYAGALMLVAGVAVGALAWWAGIAALVTHLRGRMNDRWLDRINFGAGGLLMLFGIIILSGTLYQLNV